MTDSTGSDVIQPNSSVQRFIERVVRLPRLARIGLAAVLPMMTTLLLTPIIDSIYVNNFFDFDTRMAPAIVGAAVGIVVYLIGWVVLVGYAGEKARPRRVVFWYFVVGGVELAFLLLLLMTGALDVAR